MPLRMQQKMEKANAKHQKYKDGAWSNKFGLSAIICAGLSLVLFGVAVMLTETTATFLFTSLFILCPVAALAAIILGAIGSHRDGRKMLARIGKVIGIVELSAAAFVAGCGVLLLLMSGGL